jgi:hypothetical protein
LKQQEWVLADFLVFYADWAFCVHGGGLIFLPEGMVNHFLTSDQVWVL